MGDDDIDITIDTVPAITCNQCGQTIDVSEEPPISTISCPNCSAEQIVPARFGPFLLVGVIGQGGMGCVYHGYDESLDRFVAIKVLQSSFGDDPVFVQNFQQEAQAAAGLNHRNVVQIYSFGQEKGQPYIVMELVSGGRFNEMIAEKGQLDEDFVMQVGRNIAAGLEAAANAGLLHGDVKPENILLDENGEAKLVDFGLASSIGKKDTESIWGTPNYIAPEKVRRQKIDARSDIYSLGATLYHALAGRPPFGGEDAIAVVKARLEERPTPLSELRENIGKEIETLVLRMLEPEPFRRYPTYASLRGDMSKVAATLTDDAPARGPRRPKGKITIKRKGKTIAPPVTADAATQSDTPSAASQRKKGKLVITKSAGRSVMDRADQPAEETDPGLKQERQAARRRKSLVPLIIFLVIALAVGGGIGLYFQNEIRQERRDRFRTKTEIARIVDSMDTTHQKGVTAQSETIKLVRAANTARSNSVAVAAMLLPAARLDELTGLTGLTDRPEPPPEPAPGPEPAPTSTNALPAADASTNAPPAAPAADAVAAEAAPAPEPQPPEPTVGPDGLPLLHTLADRAKVESYYTNALMAHHAFHDSIDAFRQATNDIRITISHAHMTQTSADQSTDREEVSEALSTIHELADTLPESISAMNAALTASRTAVLTIQNRYSGLTQQLARANGRLDEARAERDRLAEEARRAEEVRRQATTQAALIDRERQEVRQLHGTINPLIRTHRFQDAIKRVEPFAGTFTTGEAKADLQTIVDRLTLLADLKTFIISSLADSGPCEYCWRDRADILDADAEGLGIKGAGKRLPWKSIQPKTFVRVSLHCATHSDGDLKRIDRARLRLAIAVYMIEYGAGERAGNYVKKALEIWDRPKFQEYVERVIAYANEAPEPDRKDQEDPGGE